MSRFGEYYIICEGDEVIITLPDLRTNAQLVLVRRTSVGRQSAGRGKPFREVTRHQLLAGWQGWTGYRLNPADPQLRWVSILANWDGSQTPKGYDDVATALHKMADDGVPILEMPKRAASRQPPSQHNKVFKWQRECMDAEDELSLTECQTLANQITRSGYWNKVTVTDGRRRRSAGLGGGKLKLPKWARRKWVIIDLIINHNRPGSYTPETMWAILKQYEKHIGRSFTVMKAEAESYGIKIG